MNQPLLNQLLLEQLSQPEAVEILVQRVDESEMDEICKRIDLWITADR